MLTTAEICPYITLGDSSNPALVFFAGFPDDQLSPWAKVFDELKDKYYILSLCFPQFEKNSKFKSWGYDFPVVMNMVSNTIEKCIPNRSFTLITHDWGSLLGYWYVEGNPTKVERFVSLDIGLGLAEGVYGLFVSLFYRCWLAFAYVCANLFGENFGDFLMFSLFAVFRILPFVSPTRNEKVDRPLVEIRSRMCYPYFYLLKGLMSGKFKASFPANCPFLFIYGSEKNVMFHSQAFLEKMKQSEKCVVKSYRAGHWLQRIFPKEIAIDIISFLKTQ